MSQPVDGLGHVTASQDDHWYGFTERLGRQLGAAQLRQSSIPPIVPGRND
jgi:hypothetical protein